MQMLNADQRKRLAIPLLGIGLIPARFGGVPGGGPAPGAVSGPAEGRAGQAGAPTLPATSGLPAALASPAASAMAAAASLSTGRAVSTGLAPTSAPASVAVTGRGVATACAAAPASAAEVPIGTSFRGFPLTGARPISIALPALAAASSAPGPQHSARSAGAARILPKQDSARFMASPPPGQALAKRAFDLCFALTLLAVALPFIVLLAVTLQVASPGPVFFVQQRVGRGGKLFGCIKLRTMRRDADAALAHLLATCPDSRREWEADHKLRRDPRVSPLGRVVRKLSLDELPQLINIIRGEMSVVGPRPIIVAEIQRYGGAFADYCAVRPGLTGLWQVSGRNDTTYDRRVELDSVYVRQASFWFDCGIVLRTVPAVLLGRGCY